MSGDEDALQPGGVMGLARKAVPAFIRRRYAVKFGLVLLVMAISIGGIGIVATETISAETEVNVEDEYRGVAESERNLVSNWVEEHKATAEYISLSPELQEGANSTTSRLNREQAQIGNDAHAVHLVEDSGDGTATILNSSGELEPGTTLSGTNRAWFPDRIEAIRDITHREDHLVQETYQAEGIPVVGFVSPVAGSDDRYVLVEISALSVAEEFQGSQRAEGGFTQVVSTDDNRVILTEPENSDQIGTTYSENDGALRALQNANDRRANPNKSGVLTGVGPNDVLDEEYAVGYAPIGETEDWVVVTHGPSSSVFGFVQTINQWGIIATAIAVLLIGVTGTALGYSTSTAIDRLTAKTQEMREGDLDVTLATHRIDNIGRLYDGFAEMRDSLDEQINEAEQARKKAEVSRAEAMELSQHLQTKAEEYSQVMQDCAGGDLTQRMDRDIENESMDTIAEEFNEMIEELEKTTGQLKSYVTEVEEAGMEVEQSATTVRKASEQVADSIQKIAIDADDQKDQLQTISETIDDIEDELRGLAEGESDANVDAQLVRIEAIAKDIREIAEVSEETQAETDTVSAAAEEQAAELNEVSERANDLQRYAQPLRDILDRFETEAEHEFVFSVGPTGSGASESDD